MTCHQNPGPGYYIRHTETKYGKKTLRVSNLEVIKLVPYPITALLAANEDTLKVFIVPCIYESKVRNS
jgi:hypothetical protein